ncbi:hypothetical protein [Kitasatospora cineracea]|uniref:hypothetical protein n=1 Tax=Kitasatospora cineracea TaxID=88074 RepID=UPI0037A29E3D
MTVRARKLGLRVAALAAAGLVLTACNDDLTDAGAAPSSAAGSPAASASPTGKGKAKEPANGGKPGTKPSGGTATGTDKAAQARMGKLALTAAEWETYAADVDDSTSTDNYVMDKSCANVPDGTAVKGLTATVTRFVKQDHESDTTFASTEADQFASVADAHQEVQAFRENAQRCPNYTEDDDKYTGVHAGKAPAVPGADEVYLDEGKATYPTTDGGRTDPRDFVFIAARKGTVVVKVFLDVDPNFNAATSKDDARAAIAKLAAKW